MEQAILITLGIIISLMLYLDRGRRVDNTKLRDDMNRGFEEARADNAKLREEARADNAKLREEVHEGFKWVHNRLDKLTDVVMDLCRRVGRLEGRAEALESNPDASL